MKVGDIVIQIIKGCGVRTASLARLYNMNAGCVFTSPDHNQPDDVTAYDEHTGEAKVNYISGFTSYIVPLDDGEEAYIKVGEVE